MILPGVRTYRDRVRDDLLAWRCVVDLMPQKEFARTDSEVQAQATVDGANILAAAIRSASQQAHPLGGL